MEVVAQHLQNQAISRSLPLERDLFGRSSFNRYYYATFLLVRSALAQLRPEWREVAHAAVPQILRGSVTQELKQGRTRANRTSDYALVTLCSRGLSAAEDLAKIMDQGRMTRVTADYEPEIPVDFADSPNFKLNTVPVEQARAWPHKAGAFASSITLAWKQVHAGP